MVYFRYRLPGPLIIKGLGPHPLLLYRTIPQIWYRMEDRMPPFLRLDLSPPRHTITSLNNPYMLHGARTRTSINTNLSLIDLETYHTQIMPQARPHSRSDRWNLG